MGQAQLFGQQVQRRVALLRDFTGECEVLGRAGQGLHVPLARDEQALGHGLPAGGLQQAPAQRFQAVAGLQAQGDLAVRRGGQVGLVEDLHDAARVHTGQPRADALVLGLVVGLAHAAEVVQEEHHVGVGDRVPAARHADALDLVGRVIAQAGGVGDVQRHALDLDGLADLVARGAGDGRDDGELGPGQRIEQRALADVGLAGEHHLQAVAQQGALAGAGLDGAQLRRQAVEPSEGIGLLEEVDFFLGEVERGFHQHAQLDELVAQHADLLAQRAAEGPARAAGGGFSAGVDQVGHGLGLGQVELAVQEGALGELSRLGQPQVDTGLDDPRQQQLHHHGAPVGLQLQHMLAGVGMRGRKVQREALVDGGALGVAERPVGRFPRLQVTAANGPDERRQILR
mmetsp:Transcript_32493/g.76308  ORF Transcript_32493/g.76308 Transcript_32493/m.76308 type:complete len:400 (-) Transcript_32493:129-1328(-)